MSKLMNERHTHTKMIFILSENFLSLAKLTSYIDVIVISHSL